MTLLGELYANGFGVANDDKKAAEWYKLAADRGDREAMFALAMFRFAGRGGPRDRDDGARLLAAAAKLGHAAAAYDLGLLYLEGQQFPQDFTRAAELFRTAARAGSPEAQYALATLYKEGRGVAKDPQETATAAGRRRPGRQPRRDGRIRDRAVQRHRRRQGRDSGRRAAAEGRAARQPDRAEPPGAHAGERRGIAADPTEAVKWHLISKAGGDSDPYLDDFAGRQTPRSAPPPRRPPSPGWTPCRPRRHGNLDAFRARGQSSGGGATSSPSS